jgi:acyl-CoA synthetase (AMP-forming)/AMP-acid ligase II
MVRQHAQGDAMSGTMIDLLQEAATQVPDKVYCIYEGRRTSYSEFFDRVRRVAGGLDALGLPADERIALLCKNSDRVVEVLYGGAMARHPLVLLNWRLAPAEWVDVTRDAGVRILFTDFEYVAQARAIADKLPSVKTIVVIDPNARCDDPRVVDYETWLEGAQPLATWCISLEDDFLQLYTSGTTGRPKGVVQTHANHNSLAEQWLDLMGPFPADEHFLIFTPFFHASGITFPLVFARYRGTVEIQRAVDPARILAALEGGQVTATAMVPTLIGMLTPLARKGAYPSLRRIYYGASTIDAALLGRAMDVFGCEFTQIYGATETAAALTLLSAADHMRGGHVINSAGKFSKHAQVRLVDPSGADVPAGQAGEVWVKSRAVMKGYWRNPAATKEALVDGWYRTGDVGRIDEEGYLYVIDRAKDMIISGGENVYSAEVENALAAHPSVAEVAVVAAPDARWGEAVAACIVPRPGTAPTLEELRTFLRERLAGYKMPRKLVLMAALPRNSTGKVLKFALRAQMKEQAALPS